MSDSLLDGLPNITGLNDTCMECGNPIPLDRMYKAALRKLEPTYCSDACNNRAKSNRSYERRRTNRAAGLKQYDVRVSWTMTGIMMIEANSMEEAVQQALSESRPMPKGKYRSGSIRLDEQADE